MDIASNMNVGNIQDSNMNNNTNNNNNIKKNNK